MIADGAHLYAYVENSPIQRRDPTGRIGEFVFPGVDKMAEPTWATEESKRATGYTVSNLILRIHICEDSRSAVSIAELKDAKLQIYAHNRQTPSTGLWIATQIHELVHVRQHLDAWDTNWEALHQMFPAAGVGSRDVFQEFLKFEIREWDKQYHEYMLREAKSFLRRLTPEEAASVADERLASGPIEAQAYYEEWHAVPDRWTLKPGDPGWAGSLRMAHLREAALIRNAHLFEEGLEPNYLLPSSNTNIHVDFTTKER